MKALAGLLALVLAGALGGAQAGPLRSGYADMSPTVRALQDDDMQNPASLWVQDGSQRFAADCARCHTTASMRGVAARYPAWDAAAGRPVTLTQRIKLCGERHVQAPALAPESEGLIALQSYVAQQSRGQPIQPDADPRLQPARQFGEQLFRQRVGQLGFSCAQCHDDNAGRKLAGSTIPQGHPNAYPIYRLEWQGMGSLQRRLRNCMTGVRAEPYPPDSAEATALELYLHQRAAGLAVESPGVRP